MAGTTSHNTTGELQSSSPANDYGACNNLCYHSNVTPSESPQQRQSSDELDSAESKEFLVWRKPWITALVLFFVFYILWAHGVVIKRYWILEDWEASLPGLGESALRKLSMRYHMTFGAIAIFFTPIQMITPFTSRWKKNGDSMARNWYRRIHRYSGRVYVMCAILAFVFGQWFICLKRFTLVGGYNMGAAFSLAGFSIAYFAYMTWKTAPSKKTNGRYTIEDHRNYAIRSFSQIIAPLLYRYWYVLLAVLNVHRTPYLNNGDANKGENLVCDDRNVCHDYLRPFDAIYCWLYWISALIVAEVVIACLPRHQKRMISTVSVPENEMEAPLLETLQPTMDESSHTDSNDTNTESDDTQEESQPARAIANEKDDRPNTWVVNFVGCLLAVLTAMVTGPILLMTMPNTWVVSFVGCLLVVLTAMVTGPILLMTINFYSRN